MKKVFIVTLNFNTATHTHTFLDSVTQLDTEGIALSIIIVENGSKEPFELSETEKKQPIHVIYTKENTGFTGGNNIGISYALSHGAEYVLIVNNDTIVDKGLLQNLLRVLDSDKKIGMTTPKIYFAKGHEFHKDRYKREELGKVLWYAGGFTDWNHVTSIHRGVDEVDHGQYDKEASITFATGCCMLLKIDVLEKVGLFDNRFFLYFEDADLNERIQNAGYKIFYVPQAILWHVNASSTGGSGSSLQDYFLTRNRMLFGMRYAPLRTKIALFRESLRFLRSGRPMQKKGIQDFYLGKFGKGSYFKK